MSKKHQFNSDKYYKERVDFEYLKRFRYQITHELGRGGYGVVYKAKHSAGDHKDVAIKINFNTVARELVYTEIAYLDLIKGKESMPRLVDLFNHQEVTHIVIEYFEFKPFISFFDQLKIEDVKHYLYQLLRGLKNLKDCGIYHRDIKPSNFLYNLQERKGIIIDYGLAQIDQSFVQRLQASINKRKQEGQTLPQEEQKLSTYKKLIESINSVGSNKIGTQTYMPLESILHHPHQSYQSDIWPVGVIFLQFVARKYSIFNNLKLVNKPSNVKNYYYINYIMQLAVFFGKKVIDQCRSFGYELILPKDLDKTVNFDFKSISYLEGFDDTGQNLLKRMLELNPSQRIKVQAALAHPFFDSIRQQVEGL